ncbi:MAG: lipase [Alcanivorax borkumensis]|jgi:acetyl esterase/lipase|uniref:Lipase/esterase n=1 Tax=Alcanivorax borkumensis (strain ATCC 700651 / DSM 11573 / NCIMB 13689 / SK2) TaxID=393595 RepID=Q0VLP6_ALCBS|nr:MULTISPECIES: alpha/beta hydrolase [Alcanivorax]OJH07521.1 MAG: lipase [Alcanivorax borkumensis]EUC71049.1 lipase [Alcanivorax sp. 97CO-5]PKG02576.1 alpha/beta hydrolase [Alcanivorax sp. 97CO-6]CAL17902.1 lipase/esterase [Alcanivorax borkumensis SK2]BAP15365.1 lipase/esterase [Alcanivorax sp. NBRC 101098]
MSLQARLIKAVTKRTIKRSGLNQDQLVRHLRKVFNETPVLTLLPRGVKLSRVEHPAFTGDRISVQRPEMAVLYLHGGAYIGGITKTYHNLAGRLAKKLNAEVFLPVYPFAPEHPYPAAVNRVMEAYEYLLSLGKQPQDIVIAGDSAGGGLTLATLLHIRDKGLEQPRCAVTFSPASNAFPDDSILEALDPSDAMLSADIIRTAIEIYTPNPEDRSQPYASPCLGDYTNICPLLITASTDELLYADGKRVKRVAEKAGVKVTWIERPGVFHVWPVMVPFLPEANKDLKRIVAFIKEA